MHLLLTLKIVQGLVPFCVAVGKAFNCTYLDPLCVQYVSLPHCPNIFHISDISSVQQCPAVSSSLAVIRISWVNLPTSHAVPCRFLVKTWWDRIACSPISPSLALGSVVTTSLKCVRKFEQSPLYHFNSFYISSAKTWLQRKTSTTPSPIGSMFSQALNMSFPSDSFRFGTLSTQDFPESLSYGSQSQHWEPSSACGIQSLVPCAMQRINLSSIYSITKDSFIIWYHMLLWYIYIFFVIVACSGHQFHKFSVRLLTHNSVAVVNGLLQSQPCWGGKQRWNDLKHSENIWWNHPLHPFASICITAQFLFRWYKTAYEESHALLFTIWQKMTQIRYASKNPCYKL